MCARGIQRAEHANPGTFCVVTGQDYTREAKPNLKWMLTDNPATILPVNAAKSHRDQFVESGQQRRDTPKCRDARMRRGKLPFIPVGEFYTRHAEALQLKLVGPALGFERKIREPTINRPGLALSGFFTYFAGKRIQVLGNAEVSYLKSLANRRTTSSLSAALPTAYPLRNRIPTFGCP